MKKGFQTKEINIKAITKKIPLQSFFKGNWYSEEI